VHLEPDPVHLAALARLQQRLPAGLRLCVGMDTVQVSALAASLAQFGERFVERLFTAGEQRLAGRAPPQRAERLAARFAAKEAALKAFGWSEAGLHWHQIEVVGEPGEPPRLVLHGQAAALLRSLAVTDLSLSLSHACDLVVALARPDLAPLPALELRTTP